MKKSTSVIWEWGHEDGGPEVSDLFWLVRFLRTVVTGLDYFKESEPALERLDREFLQEVCVDIYKVLKEHVKDLQFDFDVVKVEKVSGTHPATWEVWGVAHIPFFDDNITFVTLIHPSDSEETLSPETAKEIALGAVNEIVEESCHVRLREELGIEDSTDR